MRSDGRQPIPDGFRPLEEIVVFDDFDRGPCGWLDLTPNFTEEGFETRATILDKARWGAPMLSTATFRYVGTHGSLHGTYSLKIPTKARANSYAEIPRPGSMGHAIKRISRYRDWKQLQIELFYSYTPEQDRIALGEKDIRAFGVLFDLQDEANRYFPGVRYLNAVDGELKQRWQISSAADVSDQDWAYGREGEWNKRAIDPLWYGRRYPDGSSDAWAFVEDGAQQLIYNESDDKINWQYLRLLVDLEDRRYVELQSGRKVFDLSSHAFSLADPYYRIRDLVNPVIWIETDADRRVYLFVDSVVISASGG